MRKQLKALLITVALVTLSTGLIGCNNEKKAATDNNSGGNNRK